MLMPSDRPGSLRADTYADIIAFIAQKNGYPAGSTELGTDVETLKRILITAKPVATGRDQSPGRVELRILGTIAYWVWPGASSTTTVSS